MGKVDLYPMFLVLTSIDIWYDNTLLYFVPQHGKIFSMIVIVLSWKIGLLRFLVVHRKKHGFDNMGFDEKNESKIKKEIFLELEIQRVIK